ncbi:MAG: thioesterase family protein [Hyphomicrobium sp.]|nr:thioesterase family protein [Hyphomicrobium sp.]
MNLWLRLIWLLVTARWRGTIALPDGYSAIRFRVWPHDLDPSIHMNNGRYLTLMDLGRLDVMFRSGLWRVVQRNGWTPIASTVAIRFRRELRPFQKFNLETRLVCWDETLVVMEQIFVIGDGSRAGQVAARALFKGGLYDRRTRRFVPISQMMQAIGIAAESPAPSPEVDAFLHADRGLKGSTTVRGPTSDGKDL